MMDKSNFKIITDGEIDVALSTEYSLNLPIVVNESKVICNRLRALFTKFVYVVMSSPLLIPILAVNHVAGQKAFY